jgi:hypothetical protein
MSGAEILDPTRTRSRKPQTCPKNNFPLNSDEQARHDFASFHQTAPIFLRPQDFLQTLNVLQQRIQYDGRLYSVHFVSQ